jgi:hypothetical protein
MRATALAREVAAGPIVLRRSWILTPMIASTACTITIAKAIEHGSAYDDDAANAGRPAPEVDAERRRDMALTHGTAAPWSKWHDCSGTSPGTRRGVRPPEEAAARQVARPLGTGAVLARHRAAALA